MRVGEAMTRNVQFIDPNSSLQSAARMMADLDTGCLPVGENDRLIGMLTDRDIAIRCCAEGKGPDTMVREAMTSGVKYCFEDEDIEEIARNMGDQQVRRLPVMNRDKRLVGILALGDVAKAGARTTGDALTGISQPAAAAH